MIPTRYLVIRNYFCMTIDTQISEREREILRLVATGATNQEIAQELHISVNTVKVHLRNIFGKIGVTSRTEATVYAMRMGLVQVDEPAAASPVPEQAAPPPTPPKAEATPPTDAAPPETSTAPLADAAPPALPAAYAPVTAPPPASNRRGIIAMAVVIVLLIIAFAAVLARGLPTTLTAPTDTTSGNATAPVDRWRSLAALPEGRAGFALASFAYGGRTFLYAIAGDAAGAVSDQTVRYDISTNTWAPRASKPTAVGDVQAAVVGNKIFVPGGRLADGSITDRCEAYTPQRDQWEPCAALPAPRSGYALVALEGKLYLLGGTDGTGYRAEVWQYDPESDAWSERTTMPTPRAFAAAAALDRQIYVVGGLNDSGPLAITERYIPAEEGLGTPWSPQTPLGAPAAHGAAAAAAGQIFLFTASAEATELAVYNPEFDTWATSATPLSALRDLRADVAGSKLYVLGGQAAEAASATMYEYPLFTTFLPLQER